MNPAANKGFAGKSGITLNKRHPSPKPVLRSVKHRRTVVKTIRPTVAVCPISVIGSAKINIEMGQTKYPENSENRIRGLKTNNDNTKGRMANSTHPALENNPRKTRAQDATKQTISQSFGNKALTKRSKKDSSLENPGYNLKVVLPFSEGVKFGLGIFMIMSS